MYTVGNENGNMYTPTSGQYYNPGNTTPVSYTQVLYQLLIYSKLPTMPGMETADNPCKSQKQQSLTQKYVETKFIYSEELYY